MRKRCITGRWAQAAHLETLVAARRSPDERATCARQGPVPLSGLIIEVPEAEPAVARHRERLDASAPLGVPAHITVLFPFTPAWMIDLAVLAQLEHLFSAVSRFRFQMDHTEWSGDNVLWLAPRDPGPFRALTQRVCQAFPAFPPFQRRFDDVVPHLTIGHRPSRKRSARRRGVRPGAPSHRRFRHRSHLDDSAIRWRTVGQGRRLHADRTPAIRLITKCL